MSSYGGVSLVIIDYNSIQDTIGCIESVKRGSIIPEEIIVVDSFVSTSKTLENVCRQYGVTYVGLEENRGYAAAANVGIELALRRDISYVGVLNPDTRFDEASIQELLCAMEADIRIWVAGPLIYNMYDERKSKDIQSCGQVISRVTGRAHPVTLGEPTNLSAIDVPYVSGAAIFIRRRAIETIGCLDEGYFLYYEETDFCYRVRLHHPAARVVAVPSAVLWHRSGSSTPNSFGAYYGQRSRMLFLSKYHKSTLLLSAMFGVALAIARLLLRGRHSTTGTTKYSLLGIWDGILKSKRHVPGI